MSSPRRPRHRPAHAHDEEHEANHERWLLTYADMITLLMVLFIVLFAVSVVDKQKFAELADGLSHQFGASVKVLPDGTGVLDGGKTANADQGQLDNNPGSPITPVNQSDTTQQLQDLAQARTVANSEHAALHTAQAQITAALQAKGLQNSVSFAVDARGLVVSIVTDQVLFATGQAALEPAGQQILEAIGPALRALPNDISVEGHTDNVPISGGPFPSNWELSAVRATTVLRFLVATAGLQEDRMSATGYADTKPTVPNDTPAHQAQNRRIDIVILATTNTQGANS